jgi:hypothetical protein
MAKSKAPDFVEIFSKRMIIGGFLFLLTGVLLKYGVDWPTILIIIGTILLLKGILIKTKHKLI